MLVKSMMTDRKRSDFHALNVFQVCAQFAYLHHVLNALQIRMCLCQDMKHGDEPR